MAQRELIFVTVATLETNMQAFQERCQRQYMSELSRFLFYYSNTCLPLTTAQAKDVDIALSITLARAC